jgi:hypothetical protein
LTRAYGVASASVGPSGRADRTVGAGQRADDEGGSDALPRLPDALVHVRRKDLAEMVIADRAR